MSSPSSSRPSSESWWKRPLFERPTGAQVLGLVVFWLVCSVMMVLAVTDLFRDVSASKLFSPAFMIVASAAALAKTVGRYRALRNG